MEEEGSGVSAGTKRKRDEGEAETGKGKLYCRICEVWCNSEEMMETHVKGRKHRGKQITEEDIRGEPGRREEARKRGLWCGICEVVCNGETTMERHLNGRKHKAREAVHVKEEEEEEEEVEKTEGKEDDIGEEKKEDGIQTKKDEDGASNRPTETMMGGLWCKICKVNCSSMAMIEGHFEGKKHRAKAAKLGMGPVESSNVLLLQGVDEVKKEKNRELWCLLCRFQCYGQPAMTKHLNGAEHKANASLRWEKHTTSMLATNEE